MGAWWKRWESNKTAKQDAALLLRDYGLCAYETAIQRARKARNERNPKRARHYSAVAWHVANSLEAIQSAAPNVRTKGEGQLEKPTSDVMRVYAEE